MDLIRNAQPKPMKGAALIARKERRRQIVADEEEQKAIARRRDKRCRYPDCPYCRRYKDLIPQAAHVVQAKGMGGDAKLIRSQAKDLMLLDPLIHALQEKHDVEIVPLDAEDGTFGPCEFWKRGTDGVMFLVARETAPFQYEHD